MSLLLINQISVFVDNRPGRLSLITKALADESVDIRALSVSDTVDFGVVRMITSDNEKALQLIRDAGFTASKAQVIAVSMKDIAGSINKIFDVIAAEGINIISIYAFHSVNGEAFSVMRTDNTEGTVSALKKAGICPLNDEEVFSL